MCDVQVALKVATCTEGHLLSPSNFSSSLPHPPWLPFFLEPRNLPTLSLLCSPRGVPLIQHWSLPLVTDHVTGARKINGGFLSCLGLGLQDGSSSTSSSLPVGHSSISSPCSATSDTGSKMRL